jgi:hypothetical protein
MAEGVSQRLHPQGVLLMSYGSRRVVVFLERVEADEGEVPWDFIGAGDPNGGGRLYNWVYESHIQGVGLKEALGLDVPVCLEELETLFRQGHEEVAVVGDVWSSRDYWGEYDEGFDWALARPIAADLTVCPECRDHVEGPGICACGAVRVPSGAALELVQGPMASPYWYADWPGEEQSLDDLFRPVNTRDWRS